MIGALGKVLRCLEDKRESATRATRDRHLPRAGLMDTRTEGKKGAEDTLPPPLIGVLKEHDPAGLNPRLLQGKLAKLVNTSTFASFRGALDNLLEAGRPPEVDDSFGGIEARDFPLERHRSMARGAALVCMRVQPFDHARAIAASQYMPISRRFLGIKP